MTAQSTQLNGLIQNLLGSLRDEDHNPQWFYPLNITAGGLLFLAEPGREVGCAISVRTSDSDIPLTLQSVQDHPRPDNDSKIYFAKFNDPSAIASMSDKIDQIRQESLTALATLSGQVGAKQSAKYEATSIQNFFSTSAIEIQASTFGMRTFHELLVANLTSGGMMVAKAKSPTQAAPFRVNTTLEIMIDHKKSWLPRPLSCVGHVARVETVGIYAMVLKLSEFSDEDHQLLEEALEAITGGRS